MIKKIILFLFLFPSISFGGTMNMIGEKGKAEEIDRVIIVKCTIIFMNQIKLK